MRNFSVDYAHTLPTIAGRTPDQPSASGSSSAVCIRRITAAAKENYLRRCSSRATLYRWAGKDLPGKTGRIVGRTRRNQFRLAVLSLALLSGCSQQPHSAPLPTHPRSPRVFVVAPVLNFSGREDLEPLRLTDLIASELQTFSDVQVVPVNRAIAVLAQHGTSVVATPDEAVALARAVGADATLVFAITEYDPYDPPVVGMTAQWYQARATAGASPETGGGAALHLQVQRVFNAADKEVARKLRTYADDRDRHASPYGWRRYQHSQELYVRYCGWAVIETMFTLDAGGLETAPPHEAHE